MSSNQKHIEVIEHMLATSQKYEGGRPGTTSAALIAAREALSTLCALLNEVEQLRRLHADLEDQGIYSTTEWVQYARQDERRKCEEELTKLREENARMKGLLSDVDGWHDRLMAQGGLNPPGYCPPLERIRDYTKAAEEGLSHD